MLNTTLGQLLVNDALPEDMQDHDRVLDKKGIKDLLREVAEKHPEEYREISHALNQVGRRGAQESGGMSFGLQHLRKSSEAVKTRARIENKLGSILDREDLDDKDRERMIIETLADEMKPQQEAVLRQALKEGNPLARQILSGARGSAANLATLIGSDLMYSDHRGRPIPVPVLNSYSEGLSPEEYWAGAYGTRKGVIDLKMATRDAGFLSKQLNQVAHRLVVIDEDYDDDEQKQIFRGMPVDTDDMDNEGTLLASDVGPYKKNTTLTPKVLKHLKRLGHDRIVIRSPIVGGSPEGGVYARDVGVRERGGLPGRGEMVGLTAAQALSEPLTQAQISSKHTGGIASEQASLSGFQHINQMVQVPRSFKGGAAHAQLDGTVQRVEEAPAGGHYITIDDEQHYVGKDFKLKVKKGDKVEAGDVLSEGIPNPSEIVKHKGLGEGRRYFSMEYRKALQEADLPVHRRNVELLARGLINHVRLTNEYEDGVPGDVIPYSTLEHRWKPREGHETVEPRRAVGQYLERPVLHYTIGTKVQRSMLQDLERFGVKNIAVHREPPPFQPEMIRGMYSLQHDPDWQTRMYGSGLKKGLLTAAQRGAVSEERGSSFVPSLARSVDFGHVGNAVVKTPEAPIMPSNASESMEDRKKQPKKTWFGGRFKMASEKEMEKLAGPFPAIPAPSANPYSAPKVKKPIKPIQPSTPAAPANPYSSSTLPKNLPGVQRPAGGGWMGGLKSPPSPMSNFLPMAAPFLQQAGKFHPVLPTLASGMMMAPQAMRTLTSGQRYVQPGAYRPPSYATPSMGGFRQPGQYYNMPGYYGGVSQTVDNAVAAGQAAAKPQPWSKTIPEVMGHVIKAPGDFGKDQVKYTMPFRAAKAAVYRPAEALHQSRLGLSSVKKPPITGSPLTPAQTAHSGARGGFQAGQRAAAGMEQLAQGRAVTKGVMPKAPLKPVGPSWMHPVTRLASSKFGPLALAKYPFTRGAQAFNWSPMARTFGVGQKGSSFLNLAGRTPFMRMLGAAGGVETIVGQPARVAWALYNAKTPQEREAALQGFRKTGFEKELSQGPGGWWQYPHMVATNLARPYNMLEDALATPFEGLTPEKETRATREAEIAQVEQAARDKVTNFQTALGIAKQEGAPAEEIARLEQELAKARKGVFVDHEQRALLDDPTSSHNLTPTEVARRDAVADYNAKMIETRRMHIHAAQKRMAEIEQRAAAGQSQPGDERALAWNKSIIDAKGDPEGRFQIRQYKPGVFNWVPGQTTAANVGSWMRGQEGPATSGLVYQFDPTDYDPMGESGMPDYFWHPEYGGKPRFHDPKSLQRLPWWDIEEFEAKKARLSELKRAQLARQAAARAQ